MLIRYGLGGLADNYRFPCKDDNRCGVGKYQKPELFLFALSLQAYERQG
jgi:hypothetical protein